MPYYIECGDITNQNVDAIVCASNPELRNNCAGVSGAIFQKGGPQLIDAALALGGCDIGTAKVTKAFNQLVCDHVIFTVGPRWHGGYSSERDILASCYKSCLKLAAELECSSIAFPIISTGAYGFPKKEALDIAIREIKHFLKTHEDMDVILVAHDRSEFVTDPYLIYELEKYILRCQMENQYAAPDLREEAPLSSSQNKANASSREYRDPVLTAKSLDDALENMEASFSKQLLNHIDRLDIKDSECYHRANVDRRLFSNIRSDSGYTPSKTTILAFAVALRLSLDETDKLLRAAGYALSRSNEFDIIVTWFISNGIYDVFTINSTLYEKHLPILGERPPARRKKKRSQKQSI